MLNLEGAKNYINMLESLIEHVDSDNDKTFLESVLLGFNAMLEGDIHVEFSPIMGRVLKSRYIPSDADIEEVISPRGKKSFRPRVVQLTPEDLVRDTIMWIYGRLAARDKEAIDDDFAKMILFNPNPEITATGFENQSIPPVTGDLSTHPLWNAIRNEMSSVLTTSDDPYFKAMRSRLETKMIDDESSYRRLKKANQLDMEKLEKINKMTDTYKSARNTGYVDDIAKRIEAENKKKSEAAMNASKEAAEKRIAAENERKAKLANMSIADLASKFSEKSSPTRSIEDMKERIAREEAEKEARRKKWDEMFAS